MKIDAFIQLVNKIRQGQLVDDTDPTNTLIQTYTSPFDKLSNVESVRIIKSAPSAKVWGDGTTYVATDMEGSSWNAPSCGWLWGSGGKWTNGTNTVSVSDSFNRANGSLGSTDNYAGGTSVAWISEAGLPMPVISSNTAMANNSSGNSIALVNSGVSDATIQADFTIKTTNQSYIEFRTTSDASNRLLATLDMYGNISISNQATSGSSTLATGRATYVNGGTLMVRLKGKSISVYYNSAFVCSASSSVNQTSNLHGFGFYQDTTSFVDNFKIY